MMSEYDIQIGKYKPEMVRYLPSGLREERCSICGRIIKLSKRVFDPHSPYDDSYYLYPAISNSFTFMNRWIWFSVCQDCVDDGHSIEEAGEQVWANNIRRMQERNAKRNKR